MKKLLLASLAIVAFAGVAKAGTSACVRPYVSLKGTYSKLGMDGRIQQAPYNYTTAKSDWVWGGAAALGVKMCAFRTELEYNQTLTTAEDTRTWENGFDVSKGSQSYRSYMLNGYFDIPTYTAVHPYIGAGIGVARVKNRLNVKTPTDTVTKNQQTHFAYQLMAGIGYNLTCNWTLDIGYRWIDNGNSKWTSGGQKIKFNSTGHQMTAGVRYTF